MSLVILDEPYVSENLVASIARIGADVLDTPFARSLGGPTLAFVGENEAARALAAERHPLVYCNSENSIGWLDERLPAEGLPATVARFKDKVRFRELLAPRHPDFFYRAVPLAGLGDLDPAALPSPFVIKPAVGFFSMAVRRVADPADWPAALEAIRLELDQVAGHYPSAVLDAGTFIVEACVEGEEYALDVHYDADGAPVVLNVLHHRFRSPEDTSDRLYLTSAEIVREGIERFGGELAWLGEAAGLRNFPMHVEFRLEPDGGVFPIEVNPLRFAGWCAADIAQIAWGLDSYAYLLRGWRPDWDAYLDGLEGRLFCLAIADMPPEVTGNRVASFDYMGFGRLFRRVLEMRPIDYRRFRNFAFVFGETDERGIPGILAADTRDYITLR
ncbi:MAG: ATP-grasp domain-containing protein [Candidatus Krumholzibacteriota bacterium]|nr:ATP-grasp domain-containing protein [Candidatus Krumholzibacteriota bacterium]